MYIAIIILVVIILIMLAGGAWFYINKFKVLEKESVEFVQFVFETLKDKKVTIANKEKMLKEYTDVTKVIKDIKSKFVDDAKELGNELKEVYEKIRNKIKTSSPSKPKTYRKKTTRTPKK